MVLDRLAFAVVALLASQFLVACSSSGNSGNPTDDGGATSSVSGSASGDTAGSPTGSGTGASPSGGGSTSGASSGSAGGSGTSGAGRSSGSGASGGASTGSGNGATSGGASAGSASGATSASASTGSASGGSSGSAKSGAASGESTTSGASGGSQSGSATAAKDGGGPPVDGGNGDASADLAVTYCNQAMMALCKRVFQCPSTVATALGVSTSGDCLQVVASQCDPENADCLSGKTYRTDQGAACVTAYAAYDCTSLASAGNITCVAPPTVCNMECSP